MTTEAESAWINSALVSIQEHDTPLYMLPAFLDGCFGPERALPLDIFPSYIIP